MPIAEPHKELRFTRAGQATGLWILAAMAAAAAVILFSITIQREAPHPAWALLPLGLAGGLVFLALHCTRHAYLILSPIGVEIFPLIRPAAGMQVIGWSEIAAIDIDDRRITLHFNRDRTAGIHLTLSPIPKARRPLLIRALEGRAG
ncbi:hypothetical protein [Haloferula sargassicola]|uniref:PH domain-containing protein n=1 Tax=Haloferula sargassicola TaxID=490096 RepID=A0ABP9UVE3_9BACT